MESTLTSFIYSQISEIREIFEKKKTKNFHIEHLCINYWRYPKHRTPPEDISELTMRGVKNPALELETLPLTELETLPLTELFRRHS